MDAQLKRGVLEVCVLSALLKEPSYGYRIIKSLSPVVKISESTLYPILKRLETSGYLSVRSLEHNGRLRKYYAINESGKDRLRQFIDEWEGIADIYTYIQNEVRQL
ncbi:MAG: PadR family transcriptional regulator [Clostridiales bacterium]|nr:PadR family transcriptional regulator [Clostridiales bacterium]